MLDFGSYIVVAPFTVDAEHAYTDYVRENYSSLEVHFFDDDYACRPTSSWLLHAVCCVKI